MEQVIVCLANANMLNDSECYERAYQSATEYRRKKVDKIKYMSDKCLSLCAELAISACLKELGVDYSKAQIIFGENGKPYLKGEEVFFNVSHSGDYVLCVASKNELGCDIQQKKNIDLKIAKRFFFGSEYGDIKSQNEDDDRQDRFFRYWTLKESVMKATGKGFRLPLNAFEIVLKGNAPQPVIIDGVTLYLTEIDAPSGYRASLCTHSDEQQIKYISTPNMKQLP